MQESQFMKSDILLVFSHFHLHFHHPRQLTSNTMAKTHLSSLQSLLTNNNWKSFDRLPASALPLTVEDSLGLLVILTVSIAYLSRGHLWDKKNPLHHLWFEKPQADAVENGLQSKNRNISTKLEESVSNLNSQL